MSDPATTLQQGAAAKSGGAASDSKPNGLAGATVATGAYKPPAAASANPTAGAATQGPGAQQGADSKQQAPAKADGTAQQPVATVGAEAGKPAAGAPQQAQSTTQSTTQSAASPMQSQQQQTGAGAHTGTGTGGHSGTPAQPGAGAAAPATPAATSGSQPAGAFTLAPASGNGQAGNAQQAAPALPRELVRTSVSLQQAVDAVKATFTAANQAGVSSARISLSPESLGGIKISLSQTPDGLIARVAADHPEAAQTLQQGAADLKRSLEAGGMALLRLDIGSSGQQSLGSFAGSAGDGSNARGGWTGPHAAILEENTTSTPAELTVELASGSLVNVLA